MALTVADTWLIRDFSLRYKFKIFHTKMAQLVHFLYSFGILKIQNLPGESSETGVLEGVGLCPGGRKCEGDPLFEPPPK